MKVLEALSSAYWHWAGYVAARTGDYERALSRFDRADRKRRPTPLRTGYRAMVLTLSGQRAEAQAAFRELAQTAKSKNPDEEYARTYAQMFVAYLEHDLVQAERLATELRGINCRAGVRELLVPVDPTVLAADSVLSSLGIEGTDPIGFREERSGAHWMKAVEAYSKGELQALDHIEQAEAIRGASPAQKALKAGLLIHLGQIDDSERLFKEVIDQLDGAVSADARYIRLVCEYHRSSEEAVNRRRLLGKAQELAPETALHHFLPISDFNPEQVEAHFRNLQIGL